MREISIDIDEFCACDELRPVQCGVYHDEGFLVATDGHKLAAFKEEYDKDLEGKITDMDNYEIEGRYPRWKPIIQNPDNMTVYRMDMDSLEDAVVKANGMAAIHPNCRNAVKIADVCLQNDNAAFMYRTMRMFGVDEVLMDGPSRAVQVRNGESVAVFMPMFVDQYDSDAFVAEAKVVE